MNDTRYARDLGLLLAGNVTELVAQGTGQGTGQCRRKVLAVVSRSVRYIFFADPEGVDLSGHSDQRHHQH